MSDINTKCEACGEDKGIGRTLARLCMTCEHADLAAKTDPFQNAKDATIAELRAQVEVWRRKAEAYDVLVECCERLSAHQDDASPLVEAMLDAVIEAKRLREKVGHEAKSGGGA